MSMHSVLIVLGLSLSLHTMAQESDLVRVVATDEQAHQMFLELTKTNNKVACLPGWAVQNDKLTCIQWGADDEAVSYTCYEAIQQEGSAPERLNLSMFCASPTTIGVGNLD
jgi:hypothetical protein